MTDDLITITARIASAYASSHSLSSGGLLDLIREVHQALSGLSADGGGGLSASRPSVRVARARQQPGSPDHLACLECGRYLKTLKRHLKAEHGTTPARYRLKYDLPLDYPMTAPGYTELRSSMAKALGLGHNRRGYRSVKP